MGGFWAGGWMRLHCNPKTAAELNGKPHAIIRVLVLRVNTESDSKPRRVIRCGIGMARHRIGGMISYSTGMWYGIVWYGMCRWHAAKSMMVQQGYAYGTGVWYVIRNCSVCYGTVWYGKVWV